jgi:hypothetical protein
MRARTLAAALALPALALAAGEHEHGVTPSSNDAPIHIAINPEARVSVVLAGVLPPPAPCGMAANLSVKIVNQGFVTARLEADLVGTPTAVTLDLDPRPLTGAPEELRTLRITLSHPGFMDLTIAFKAHNGTPDLGGRDRVHFLMSCR